MTTGKILVTGAGGFIGGRIVECLLQVEPDAVVPTLRRWSTAVRIGRYPIQPTQCDLLVPDQIEEALEGVDRVIHCAVGNRQANVEGTRNLLTACLAAGVRRVVHVSTVDVYGRASGVASEDLPFALTDREYGDSKIEAEQVCQSFVEKGLEVVILRPTIVYGPHSDAWTVEPAERLRDGTWTLPREACAGRCNLVYVDDLVRACLLALEAEGVSGRAYNVNGADDVTWQDYVDALNAGLGQPPLSPPPATSSRVRTLAVEPVRRLIKGVFKQFEDPIMNIYKSSKHARKLMKGVQGALLSVPSTAEYDLYGRVVHFPIDRARADLGYEPKVDMHRGVELSVAWLEHEGVWVSER